MNVMRTAIIAAFAGAALTLSSRVIERQTIAREFDQIGVDACEVLVPVAQVGASAKNIFELAQSVIRRHVPESQFDVVITEDRRPLYTKTSGPYIWHEVACSIPGRIDEDIAFAFKLKPIFDSTLIIWTVINFIWLFLLVALLDWALKQAISLIQERFFLELSRALGFGEGTASKSMLTKAVRRLISSPSIQKSLKEKIDGLKDQIGAHEKRNLELAAAEIEREQMLKRTNDFLEIVEQIQHDIRGPIHSLASVIERKSVDDEDRRVLTLLFHKIRGMLDRLTVQEQAANESLESVRDHIAEVLVKEVFLEKKIAIGEMPIEVKFDYEPANLNLIRVDAGQFSRVVSNLLQNSIEAVSGQGKITVSVRKLGESVFITISDSGRGISKNRLPLLFSKGATFDKPRGKGLGLYHARSCLKRWGGDIAVDSTVGAGTSVLVQIPLSPSKALIIGRIDRDDTNVNIVVDDDVEVFSRIQPRLGKKALYFPSAKEYCEWEANADPDPARYIFDYDLGGEETGIALIAKLANPKSAILITSHPDRPDVLNASNRAGFRILPKLFLDAI